MNVCKAPQSFEEYEAYYQFRWEMLRKSLGQPLGSEQDGLEEQSFHRMILDNNNQILAIGRLHQVNQYQAQIRYMAVAPNSQGQGLGRQIITAIEGLAKQLGVKEILLNARATAIGFYQKCAYENQGFSHLLFDEIKHFTLLKKLTNGSNHQDDLTDELQNLWHKTIPLSKAMNIEISYYNGHFLQTSCDLIFNKNLHNTMFAGSIYTLATLTGWAWVHMQLKHFQKNNTCVGDIVLADANIRYKSPLKGVARAFISLNDINNEQEKCDLHRLTIGKKAHFEINVNIACGDNIVANFKGLYVIIPRNT